MAIQYVGGYTNSYVGTTSNITVSLTSLTGGIASQPSEGDLILVSFCTGNASNITLTTKLDASGYTLIKTLQGIDSIRLDSITSMKFAGVSETSLTITGGTSNVAAGGSVAVQVWRNVNKITPQDVTYTSIDGASSLNTVLPNPTAITPVTKGAVICVFGHGAHGQGNSALYSSSDLTGFITSSSNDTNDSIIGAGYKQWSSGTFDPAAFTWNKTDSITFCYTAITIALRPIISKFRLTT